MDELPRYQDMVATLVDVISKAGEPISNSEIEARIIHQLGILEPLTKLVHSGNRTELQYRLAWVRTKAKLSGLIINTSRKTWIAAQKEK